MPLEVIYPNANWFGNVQSYSFYPIYFTQYKNNLKQTYKTFWSDFPFKTRLKITLRNYETKTFKIKLKSSFVSPLN